MELYIRHQSDILVHLEMKKTNQEQRVEIAELGYEMAWGSGGNEGLKEQLKAENAKLWKILNKAYNFMKQFVVDGRSLLEWFQESIGQVVEKVRSGSRR